MDTPHKRVENDWRPSGVQFCAILCNSALRFGVSLAKREHRAWNRAKVFTVRPHLTKSKH
eukprot:1437232-Amphidinium_carterae.1